MNVTTYIATLISIVGVLVILTNIVVEVIKKATWDKLPTNILAVIVAMVLTLVAFLTWAAYMKIIIVWYYIPPVVMVAFMVAYAAMFGFDKLKETLLQLKKNTE